MLFSEAAPVIYYCVFLLLIMNWGGLKDVFWLDQFWEQFRSPRTFRVVACLLPHGSAEGCHTAAVWLKPSAATLITDLSRRTPRWACGPGKLEAAERPAVLGLKEVNSDICSFRI